MAVEPFATVADLELRWRGLSASEQDRARALLADAASLVKDTIPGWPSLDQASVRRVVCAMVRRAMATPEGLDGGMVTATQMSSGPYSQQMSYANPTGDLYLTRSEKIALGRGGKAKAYQVSLIPSQARGLV